MRTIKDVDISTLSEDAKDILAQYWGTLVMAQPITPGYTYAVDDTSPALIAKRQAEAAAYDALPELEKAKLAYAYGPGDMLYDMIEAYRLSVNGGPRPPNWQPNDQHLLAMWMAMPDLSEW